MSSLYNSRKGKKCVLYLRVSLERQVDGYSIEGQREYLQDWAAHEGMDVVEVYTDAGKSGKSISGRDEFQKMLSDIATDRIDIDYVVVFKLSRFGRNAKDVLNTLSLLQQHNVNLLCKEDGLDSSTSMGKVLIAILGAIAEMERENILAQSMLGRREKAKQGGWNGGVAPFGYTRKSGKDEILQINEEEARIVRLIFDKFVNQNMGYSDIAGYLNQQGISKTYPPVATKRFTDWTLKQVMRILTNPVYIGKVTYGRTRQEVITDETGEHRRITRPDDYIVSDAPHEPIISEELFEKAQLKCQPTKNPRIAGGPAVGRPKKNLLVGMLKCPQCGGAMYAAKKNIKIKSGMKEYTYYTCGHGGIAKNGQCSRNTILAEWVETEVIEYTRRLVRDPKFAADIQEKIGQKVDSSEIVREIAGYQATVKKLERSKANLERDIDRIVDDDRNAQRKRDDLNRRLDKIYDEIYDVEDKIADCEARRLAVEQQNTSAENIYMALQMFDQCFDQMEPEDKRKTLASLISEIQLHPKAIWKDGENPVKTIKYSFEVSPDSGDLFLAKKGHASSPAGSRAQTGCAPSPASGGAISPQPGGSRSPPPAACSAWSRRPPPSAPPARPAAGRRRGGPGQTGRRRCSPGSAPGNRPYPPDARRSSGFASFPSLPAALPPHRRKGHIPRFRLAPKTRSFRCASSPHATRSAGLARGPRRERRGRESSLYFVDFSFGLYLYLIALSSPTLDFPAQVSPTQVQPKKQAPPG